MEPDPPTPPASSQPAASGPQDGPQDGPLQPEMPVPLAVSAATEPRDKVSIAAFVLSLFGVGIAAIPLGIWGIVRTSRGPRRGRGFAVAALAISAVWAAATAVAMAALVGGGGLDQLEALASPPAATTAAPSGASTAPVPEVGGPLAKPKNVDWHDLEPGMCFNFPAGRVLDASVVDCRSEHTDEVIASSLLVGDGTYPGDAAIDTAAQAQCEPAFADYVGLSYESSRLELTFYTPVQEGWEDGDRRLICIVYDPERETTAISFAGSQE